MIQLASHSPRVRSLHDLVAPLFDRARRVPWMQASVAGTFRIENETFSVPRIVVEGPRAEHEPIRLGVFAGLHGDEPAGAQALVDLAIRLCEDPEPAKGYEIVLYPVCNPYGYERHVRENGAGLDLNREFWRDSRQPEVSILERDLMTLVFDGIVSLHADDTSDGLYGYAHGRVINESLLRPALAAASRFLPLNSAVVIDGFEAEQGIIGRCFEGVLRAPCEQSPQPFDVIFETPALAPEPLQASAALAAVESILSEYRRFIAYGLNL